MSWYNIVDETFYSSGTVVANGNSGIIASPVASPIGVIFPIAFTCKGSDMTVDETNDVTIDFYIDSAGEFTVGTLTFAQLTFADMLPPPEPWPGDVTFWTYTQVGPMFIQAPLPPYTKISHALGGTAKSMSYIIKLWAYYVV